MTNPNATFGELYGPSITSGVFQLGSDYISNQQRRKLEKDARKWNLEQWHRQNKYNHPIEQMARLASAGLNPNLIYGSSPGSAVGNAGAVAPGKAPDYKMTNPMIPFMNTKVQQAQSNNLRADAHYKTALAIKAGKDSGVSEKTLEYLERTMEPRVAAARVDLDIKEIKRDLDREIKPYKVANEMAMSKKNDLAADLIQGDLDNRAQGYYKGDPVTTLMKGVFNLDLSNPDDRILAQIVATAALTSHLVGNMAGALKQALQAWKLNKK